MILPSLFATIMTHKLLPIAAAVALALSNSANANETVSYDDYISKGNANGLNPTGVTSASYFGKNIIIEATQRGVNVGSSTNGKTLNLGGENTENISISTISDTGTAYGLVTLGQQSYHGGVTNIKSKNLSIIAESHVEDKDAQALFVQNSTYNNQAPGKNHATIDIKAENIYLDAKGIQSSLPFNPANAIIAFTESELNIEGNLYVNTKGGNGNALQTRGGAKTTINQSGNHIVQINGDILFGYSTANVGIDAEVNITLNGTDSYWKGNSGIIWSAIPNQALISVDKKLQITLKNNAKWIPTKVEENGTLLQTEKGSTYTAIHTVNMNGGIVDISDKNINVEVLNFDGDGTINLFALATDDGFESGTFKVDNVVNNASLDVKLKNSETKQEYTADELTPDDAKTLLSNIGGTDVKTQTTVKEGLVENGFGVNSDDEYQSAGPNTLLQSTLGLATSTPLLLNRLMMSDVRKRLGDVRSSEGTYGAWARYDGGRMSGESNLETDFTTIEVGFDTKALTPSVMLGAAFNWTESDADYQRGTADMTAYGMSLYGTWLGDNGSFVDIVGRVAKADTDLNVDAAHKGSLDNTVWSLSGEVGHRFNVLSNSYVEPQIELAYTHVDGEHFTLSAANYDIDSVDSLLGRAGIAAGIKFPESRGDAYVKLSAVHEFLGDARIHGQIDNRANVYEFDGKDTWVEFGAGSSYRVMKNAYVYADLERTAGGRIDEDWRLTAGARFFW